MDRNFEGKQPPFFFQMADRLLFSKIRKELGFSESKVFSFGAAPMKASTIDFFKSLNIPLINMYGMSETTAPQFVNFGNRDIDLLSCGVPLNGTEGIIFNPDTSGEGEIIFRGRNRFMGYSKNEKATLEAIDENGYCHSGDQGMINKKGKLIITGRIKELIVTAGGENVAPIPIEEVLKDKCKIIANVVLIGDQRRYLSALITIKSDLNGVLTPEALTYLVDIAKNVKTVEDCMKEKKITEFIQATIEHANKIAVSRAQQIRKWIILKNDFTIDSGEFTPTMKLKRKFVGQKYAAEIDSMYSDPKF